MIIRDYKDEDFKEIEELYMDGRMREVNTCGINNIIDFTKDDIKFKKFKKGRNFVVDVDGESIGIAVEGKYDVENMPEAQKKSVINLGKYLTEKYNINTILKHKDVNPTDCPGKNYPFEYIKNEILKPVEKQK